MLSATLSLHKATLSSSVSDNRGHCPNLFKIYINDLFEYLKSNTNVPYLDTEPIDCLMYADDLVLLSTSENGLQKSLNGLSKFCIDWKLSINIEKTKIMVFNKSGRLIQTNLYLNKIKVTDARTYKYLGLIFSISGKFNSAKQDLLQRGFKAVFKLTSIFKFSKPNVSTCLHLFDHVIKPVLLYGAEVWGDHCFTNTDRLYNTLKNDIVEACHIKFLRYTLGVSKKAPNLGIYGDTGRFPISFNAAVSATKYWHRLANFNDQTNKLMTVAYNASKHNDSKRSWFKNIFNMTKLILVDKDHLQLYPRFYTNKLHSIMKDKFIEGWRIDLFCDKRKSNYGNKLRTYRLFKNVFRREDYLQQCTNTVHRSAYTRFRLSAHRLNIETLRYSKPRILPEDRLCSNCTLNVCENEFHFLMICNAYDDIRKPFFEAMSLKYNYFSTLSSEDKFIWLCSSNKPYVVTLLAEFVHECFLKRDKVARQ